MAVGIPYNFRELEPLTPPNGIDQSCFQQRIFFKLRMNRLACKTYKKANLKCTAFVFTGIFELLIDILSSKYNYNLTISPGLAVVLY